MLSKRRTLSNLDLDIFKLQNGDQREVSSSLAQGRIQSLAAKRDDRFYQRVLNVFNKIGLANQSRKAEGAGGPTRTDVIMDTILESASSKPVRKTISPTRLIEEPEEEKPRCQSSKRGHHIQEPAFRRRNSLIRQIGKKRAHFNQKEILCRLHE